MGDIRTEHLLPDSGYSMKCSYQSYSKVSNEAIVVQKRTQTLHSNVLLQFILFDDKLKQFSYMCRQEKSIDRFWPVYFTYLPSLF